MGVRFNGKVFLYLLSILLAITLGVPIPLALRDQAGANTVLQLALFGLITSIVLAALIASYRYWTDLGMSLYRSIVRPLAKHAIRSRLKQAMTPMTCTGILERDGTVHLRVELSDAGFIGKDDQLYVFEQVGDAIWGVVRVVAQVADRHVICTPTNRVNPQFWERLEFRMKFDTTAPDSIYLVRKTPSDFQRVIENYLNDWR